MVAINLKTMIARLTGLGRRQMEAAAGLAVSRAHYNIEIEHFLLKLVEAQGGDIDLVLRRKSIDPGAVAAELNRALEKTRSGNARAPSLSPDLVTWLRESWLIASLDSSEERIRSGHLLAALLADDALARAARDSSPTLFTLSAEDVRSHLSQLTEGSEEAREAATTPHASKSAPDAPRGGDVLDQFCVDLTAQAAAGEIDPILGRDGEIRQMVDILTRRRQNNPILTGEPGVGKTAVVEGLALRIAADDVPELLRNVRLLSLDLGLLQAGAGVKGEFENRLKGVIDAVKSSTRRVVLFIDEAHTLIGAGGQAGQNDAANLLKPALARGELRCVAATTWAEYKKYFEKDAALTRRFQVVAIDEPPQALATAMLRGVTPVLEKHHDVRILDDAVEAAVKLSARFIPARQLPDKAVSVLDTASARVAMSQAAVPAPIEDRMRRGAMLDAEIAAIEREVAAGSPQSERVSALREERARIDDELASLHRRWESEKQLVSRIMDLRRSAEAAATDDKPAADRAEVKAALIEQERALRLLQGETPLVHPAVDQQAVAEVVASWTGIPLGRMMSDEIKTVLGLGDKLRERIIGQDHALTALAQAIRTSRAGLTDPRKPIGVFLMAGTSGVGKTETALALADLLYGGEQQLTVINMSEFKEEHKVSLLMGSPPGYVGYGEGGVLTEAVRRRPYSIILLDEMEKAHPGVQDIFYQVFDKGQMKDGEGRNIDFRNCIIIMTSNAGTDTIVKLCADPELAPEPDTLRDAVQPDLLKSFKPAFLGRCDVLVYYPLDDAKLRRISDLKLRSIAKRLAENYKASLTFDDNVPRVIAARCRETDAGARNIDHIINGSLLPELSARLLARLSEQQSVGSVRVSVDESSGQFQYELD